MAVGVGAGLQREQLAVDALAGHQLVVRADIGDPPVFQHHDLVGGADVGEPVGHQHRDPAEPVGSRRRHRAQRGEHGVLGAGVERGSGLVRDDDGRPPVEPAGHADPLPLPTRQVAPALELLRQHRAQPARQLRQHRVGARPRGRVRERPAVRVRPRQPADAHVVLRGDRPAQRLLHDDGDLSPQVLGGDQRGVPAVPRDAARRGQVQPRDQLRQRRLARAVLAHQRDHLPAAQGQRHPAQGVLLLTGVAEGHVGERDRLRAAVQRVHGRGPPAGGEVVQARAVDVHVQAQLEQPVEREDPSGDRLCCGAHGQHCGPGQRQRQRALVEQESQPAVPDRGADPGEPPPDRRHAVLLESHAHLVGGEVRGDPPVLAQHDLPSGERPQLGSVLALRQEVPGDEPAHEGWR